MNEQFFELLNKITDEQMEKVLRLYIEGFIPPAKEHTP